MQNLNFIINQVKIYSAMKAKGIRSIEELSQKLDVHRNTIIPYLSGQRALPDCLDRLLKFLDLSPADSIIENVTAKKQHGLQIASLISTFIKLQPENAYVLFGSRSNSTHKKYSDYDIGVYKIDSLSFHELSKLIDLAEEWESERPIDVNLTNLTLADKEFLNELRKSWVFLGGSFEAWIKLQEKAEIFLYE